MSSSIVVRAKTYREDLDYEDCEGIGKYLRKLEMTATRNGSEVGYLYGHILLLGEAHKDQQVRRLLECNDEFEDMLITLFKGQITHGPQGDLILNGFSGGACEAFAQGRIDVNKQQTTIQGVGAKADILLVEAVRVYQDFQSQGIGTLLMDKLASCKKVASTVYLKASPFRLETVGHTDEQVREKVEKLQRFYGRYGFSKIPGTDKEMLTTPARMRAAVNERHAALGACNISTPSMAGP
jgi:GNAT superfamily N-acetyltransferase